MILGSQHHCAEDYTRFLMTQGLFQSVHSNSITYEYYRGGCCIWAFNLNASGDPPNDPFQLPLSKSG